MKTSIKLKVLLFFFIILGFSITYAQKLKISGNNKPNIILILSDDHSFPHVGCYGENYDHLIK